MRTQKGFAVLEGLLVLVIIGMLAGIGWYVMKAQRNVDNAYDTTASSSVRKTVVQPDKGTSKLNNSFNWYLYESANKNYKIRLIDGLGFAGLNNSDFIYTREFSYKPGTPASVKTIEGGNDNPTIFYISFSSTQDNEPRGTKEESFKTDQGKTVDVYKFTQTEDPNCIDMPKGSIEHAYYVRGSKGVAVIYYNLDNDPARISLIEKMVKTVELE